MRIVFGIYSHISRENQLVIGYVTLSLAQTLYMQIVQAGGVYQTPEEHQHLRGCREKRLRMMGREWHCENQKSSQVKGIMLNAPRPPSPPKKKNGYLGWELDGHGVFCRTSDKGVIIEIKNYMQILFISLSCQSMHVHAEKRGRERGREELCRRCVCIPAEGGSHLRRGN